MIKKPKCRDCIHFERFFRTKDGIVEDQKIGLCIKNPPIPVYDPKHDKIVSSFPLVKEDWGCFDIIDRNEKVKENDD